MKLQKKFLPRSVQFDTLERSLGSHRGGSWSVENESDLAEVVGRSQVADLHSLCAFTAALSHLKKFELFKSGFIDFSHDWTFLLLMIWITLAFNVDNLEHKYTDRISFRVRHFFY